MADNDQSLYNLRYNQVSNNLEAFGGGSPSWTTLSLKNPNPSAVSTSDYKAPVRLATAGVLPNSPIYDNGTAGVGATLTASSGSALSVDSVAVAVNDRILVKDESASAHNGIYTVTNPGVSSPSIAFVQSQGGQFSGLTAVGTFSVSTTVSNLVLVGLLWNDSTVTVSSVTDDAGNTYVQATNALSTNGPTLASDIWYAENCLAGASVVTATFSSGVSSSEINISEFSGVKTSGSLVAGSNLAASNHNGSPITPTGSGQLLYSINAPASVAITGVGAPWTFNAPAGSVSGYAYYINPPVSSQTAAFTPSSSDTASASSVAFDTAGAGGTAWVLTRATDDDAASEMAHGSLAAIQLGTTNHDTLSMQTSAVMTVGTDAVTYRLI